MDRPERSRHGQKSDERDVKPWTELSRLTGGEPVTIERVRLARSGIAIEGPFEPPPLAHLPYDEQVFIASFVQAHGSIKEMERRFGISYPTVKNRLNAISARLGFLDVEVEMTGSRPSTSDVLDALDRGEIDPRQAIERLRGE